MNDYAAILGKLQLPARIDQVVFHSPSAPCQQRNATKTPRKITIAKKMSWVSPRQAIKAEDEAYSFLGIFGVNMPLLYGEGHNASIRLQEEILKGKNDLTIFAWEASRDKDGNMPRHRGVLAQAPKVFAKAGDFVLLIW